MFSKILGIFILPIMFKSNRSVKFHKSVALVYQHIWIKLDLISVN